LRFGTGFSKMGRGGTLGLVLGRIVLNFRRRRRSLLAVDKPGRGLWKGLLAVAGEGPAEACVRAGVGGVAGLGRFRFGTGFPK
jgi:hypothetical protein